MKKQYFLISTIFFLFIFVQCNKHAKTNIQTDTYTTETAIDTDIVRISGFIHNRDRYPNTKEIRIEIPNISGEFFRITTPIEENGTFHFQFKLNQAQDIYMAPYLDLLYVYPNDSLHIELDFADLNKTELSGGKSANVTKELQCYFEYTGYRKSNYSIGTDNEHNCSMEEIRKLLDDKKESFYNKRKEFLQTTQIDSDVLFLTEAMIELDYYSTLAHIILLREHRNKEIINLTVLMQEIDENTTKHFSRELYTDSHFNFIGRIYVSLNSLINPLNTESLLSYLQKQNYPNDTIRNLTFANQASIALKIKDLDSFEKLYSQINNSYLHARLMQEYQLAWEKINNPKAISDALTGKQADISSLTVVKGNLLLETITKNIGKVHVIDIWTTWCGPCIASFPHYASLVEKYKDQEVAFSFICAGGDEQQSHKMLKTHQLFQLSHHFCTNEEFKFLSKTFSPIGFPYGILVNKKGVIVDYGPHVRPEVNLGDKIDMLLKQDKLSK